MNESMKEENTRMGSHILASEARESMNKKSTDTVGAFLRLVTFTACPTYTTVHQTNDMNPDKCNKMSIKEP